MHPFLASIVTMAVYLNVFDAYGGRINAMRSCKKKSGRRSECSIKIVLC